MRWKTTILLFALAPLPNSYAFSGNQPEALQLTWNANPEKDVEYYSIYKATNSPELTRIASVAAQATSFIDYQVEKGKTYSYRINAVDFAGNESDFSNEVTISVGKTQGGERDKLMSFGNYPNPFNPETQFSYSLAENANVSLVVYDILGRRVKTLVNENKEPGDYSVKWDGKDELGRKVATGAYFAKIVVGNFVQTRKILRQK